MKSETLAKVREALQNLAALARPHASDDGLWPMAMMHVAEAIALLDASPERVEESADARQVPDGFTAVAEVISDAVGNTDWNTLKVLANFLPKMPVDAGKFDKKARLLYAAAPKPAVNEPEYVLWQKPGEVPFRKGPYPTRKLMEDALREMYQICPDSVAIVIHLNADEYPQHGYEWLDMFGDRRKKHPRDVAGGKPESVSGNDALQAMLKEPRTQEIMRLSDHLTEPATLDGDTLLSIARETGLRELMHGVSASHAREALSTFVKRVNERPTDDGLLDIPAFLRSDS